MRPTTFVSESDGRPDWHEHAKCRGMLNLFFDPNRTAQARAVCEGCPVRIPCAQQGTTEAFGVWGGTTHAKRPSRYKTRPKRPPASCGTESGYNAHRDRGEDACDPCKDAKAHKEKHRRAARKRAAA